MTFVFFKKFSPSWLLLFQTFLANNTLIVSLFRVTSRADYVASVSRPSLNIQLTAAMKSKRYEKLIACRTHARGPAELIIFTSSGRRRLTKR